MINLVLFGPPGAGKGTQSAKLLKKYNLTHISTGDLFRKHLKEGSELGTLARSYMDAGNLVPDEVVIGMVDDKISNSHGKGFIFDGFPRTIPQAKALDALLKNKKTPITGMISLDVNEDELFARLMERGKTSGRVDDQDPEKIRNRIKVYNAETLPVAAYYAKQGKHNPINGVGSILAIFRRITKIMNDWK